jgi:hypothetical protein
MVVERWRVAVVGLEETDLPELLADREVEKFGWMEK